MERWIADAHGSNLVGRGAGLERNRRLRIIGRVTEVEGLGRASAGEMDHEASETRKGDCAGS